MGKQTVPKLALKRWTHRTDRSFAEGEGAASEQAARGGSEDGGKSDER